jgi:hypothetical protein
LLLLKIPFLQGFLIRDFSDVIQDKLLIQQKQLILSILSSRMFVAILLQ